MTSGFTFMGIHSSTFGVYYIPDESALFEDRAEYEVYDEDIDWRNGGVYYGYKTKKRTFEMDCYYEDISRKTLEKMRQWLDAKQGGRLIFDETPWKYYDVKLTSALTGEQYYHNEPGGERMYSGTFTVTFTAYEPFGKVMYTSYEEEDTDGVTKYCGMLKTSEMPDAPSVDSKSFLMYNCGTETAPTVLTIGGTVDEDGLTITNETTGNTCRLVSLPPSPAYLELDSKKGSVMLVDPSAGTKELMFEYHDYGFIDLAPSGSIFDEITVTYTSGSNTVQVTGREVTSEDVDKYLRLNGKWVRIIAVTSSGVVLSETMTASGKEKVPAVTMNRMVIAGNATLTKLEMTYVPLVH